MRRDIWYEARTVQPIPVTVYDLVVPTTPDWPEFLRAAPCGHSSEAATCNNVRLTYDSARSLFYSQSKRQEGGLK